MRAVSAFAVLSLLAAASVTAAEPIVTLTVTERAGVHRTAEPVTGGFPLAKGAVKDVGELALTDERGEALPAQFDVLNRWPSDRSLRWVLLNTTVSVAANGSKKLIVTRGKAAAGGGVKVTTAAGKIVVDTGKLRFTVKSSGGFDGIHEAFLGGTQVIAPSKRGLYMEMDGDLYSTVNDRTAKVVVESHGRREVVLKAEGRMVSRRGRQGFHYVVRIHAYAGSERLRVVPVVMRLYGRRNETSKIKDFGFEIAVPKAQAKMYAIGTAAGGVRGGGLDAGDTAAIRVLSSDKHVFEGNAAIRGKDNAGKCKSTKPLGIGWAALFAPGGGVGAGVRYFWQTFPKALSVSGDGKLVLHLISAEGKPLEMFTGMGRSHELLIVPNDGKVKPGPFVGHQIPLRPFAGPKHYAASGTFGPIAPAGTPGPHAGAVAAWDAKMDGQYKKMMRERDLWRKRGVTMDAYDFLGFGDSLHWVWRKEPKGSPWDIAWDANYYDKPLMILLFWARTGRPELWDFFDVSSWHLMDIDVIHYHKGLPPHAGSRRCPATNHVGFDPPHHKQAVGNFAFDHHKSESLFYRYYLTGDRWALRVAKGLANWADKSKNKPAGRNFAHQTESLVAMYWHSGDGKWLARADRLLDACIKAHAGNKWRTGRNFYPGLMTEAMAKYYAASGSRKALDTLVSYCDAMIADGGKFPNRTYGYCVAWKETGEKKYLKAALADILCRSPGHTGKDTPMYFRNTAYATGLLAGAK